jgi:hypothetical protein
MSPAPRGARCTWELKCAIWRPVRGGPVTAWADRAALTWLGALEKESRPSLVALSATAAELESETARQFGTVAAADRTGEDERGPQLRPLHVGWTVPIPGRKTVWLTVPVVSVHRFRLILYSGSGVSVHPFRGFPYTLADGVA